MDAYIHKILPAPPLYMHAYWPLYYVRIKIINAYRMTKAMEMKANEAYGPVSSSQPPPPPAVSEGAYDL